MTTLRECANTAAVALVEKLRASRGKLDTEALSTRAPHCHDSQQRQRREQGE